MPSSFTVQEPASSEREHSPEAPPYSPITPTEQAFAGPHGPLSKPMDFMNAPPPSEPINESTNPDAIALRATLGILQLQRQRALRDMQTLERQKDEALGDPEAFSKAVATGTIKSRTAQGILGTSKNDEEAVSNSDEDEEGDANGEKPSKRRFSDFGEIPTGQNIARSPPINWSKYHVVGEVLDSLHQEQQTRPDSGGDASDRPRVHHIAAPYNPWTDKLPDKSNRTVPDASRKGPT